MNNEELTLDELMDVIAVLTHVRSIFPVVHQEEHWTVPVTAKLQQLARRRAAGRRPGKNEDRNERSIARHGSDVVERRCCHAVLAVTSDVSARCKTSASSSRRRSSAGGVERSP